LLRRYLRERESELPWLFVSERGTPFARSSVNKILQQCAIEAALPHVNPHMWVVGIIGTETRHKG